MKLSVRTSVNFAIFTSAPEIAAGQTIAWKPQ
jgi:hypothetical protein